MNEIYSILLYNQKQLIIKTVGTKQPFVVAECYSSEIAETICKLLNKEAQKGDHNNE